MWTPSQISPVAWYRTTTLALADGVGITSLSDITGHGYTLTEATNPPVFKTATQGGLGIARFNGSSSRLLNASFSDFGDEYAIFFAGSVDVTVVGGNHCIFEMSTNATTNNVGFRVDTVGFANGVTFTAKDSTTAQAVNSAIDIRGAGFKAIVCRVKSGAMDIWVNGTIEGAGPTAYVPPNASTLAHLFLGGRQNTIQMFKGDLGELGFINTSVNNGEITKITNYLRYGWSF